MRDRVFLSLLAATAGLAACGGGDTSEKTVAPANDANESDIAANVASFEWFSYEGDDPLYNELNVGPDEFSNPILRGFYPDPSIVQVGGDYYLVNSTFSYFPGIPIHHSTDLVNWTQIGNAIDRPSQLDFKNLGMSRGVFAPAITYHDGLFYILNTCVDCEGNFIVTATDPSGPWSDPVWIEDSVKGIDPSLFFDDDGRAYIINNDAPIGEPRYDGHRALWVQEFDPETMSMVGERKMVVDGGAFPEENPIWIEGPHLFRRDGQLYLLCAEGGTAEGHSQVIFKGETPFGPFTPYENNPIMTQRHLDPDRPNPITSLGHADFVEDASGTTWAVFLAVRPYGDGFHNTGRETFLAPVEWRDGWPHILEGDEVLPHVMKRPDLPVSSAATPPTQGNFTYRVEFDEPLGPQWMAPRQSDMSFVNIQDGALQLAPGGASIGSFDRPSLVVRRQQHKVATGETVVDFDPAGADDLAGLAAYHNDNYFFLLAVSETEDGERIVELRRRAGEGDEQGEVVSSIALESDGPVRMRVEADHATYQFSYAEGDDDWRDIGPALDGTLLSTQKAGGFIGATFGLYAFSPADDA